MIDLKAKELEIILALLAKHIPNVPVWAFGSRVTHTAKPYSDLDIVVVDKQKIPQAQFYQLIDAFEASSLPFRVDVQDWHRLNPSFQTIIKKQYIELTPNK